MHQAKRAPGLGLASGSTTSLARLENVVRSERIRDGRVFRAIVLVRGPLDSEDGGPR